jgi:glycosyltransferase involved in cell wall biosynthesis
MKVSICIPTLCNSQDRLEKLNECIESCLSQTYENIEVIVVDNASVIDLKDSLQNIKDPRLKIIRNDKTIPMPANFNKALSSGTGDILKPMCDDDIIHSDFVRATIKYAENSFVWVASEKFVGKDKVNISSENSIALEYTFKSEERGFSIEKLKGRGIFPTATIFSSKIYKSLGDYDERSVHFDYYFWVVASLEFNSLYCEQKLCFFRDWKESHTSKTKYNPIPSYIVCCYAIQTLISSPSLTYANKLQLKIKVLVNFIRASLVLTKKLIFTPSKIMVKDYVEFSQISLQTLFLPLTK